MLSKILKWGVVHAPQAHGGARLFEDTPAGGVAVSRAVRLQPPCGRGEPVGILELAREVSAVGKARFDRDFGHGAIRVLDEPVGVAHAQLPIERSGSHTNMLTAYTFQLPHRYAELIGYRRNRDR